MIEQRHQIGRGYDLDRPGPRRLRPLCGRADQAEIALRRVQSRQQYARRRRDPPVQPELADYDMRRQRLGIDHAHRTQQRERDRQIVMRSFLGQIGRRQIRDDALGRQRQADRAQRAAHALAAFRHRLVGEPDHDEGRQAGRDLDLHLDRARLQPKKGNRRNQRDQKRFPPFVLPHNRVPIKNDRPHPD